MSGSEDFDLVFKNMAAGAAPSEVMRITSAGVVTASGTTFNVHLIAQAPAMHKELEKVLTGLIDYPAIQKILDKVEGEA